MIDLKLAFRTLAKTPFVTAVVIASLALGIGANSAIFSLFDQIVLRPLPVPEPGQLVNFAAPGPQQGSNSCNQAGGCDEVFSYPMFRDLEKAATQFSGIAAHNMFGANLGMAGQTPISTQGVMVSGSYFPTLELTPALGRLFGPDDDRTVGGHAVAVLSHRYWETKLGASPLVLNQAIVVNGQSMTIVGVAPRGFEGTTLGAAPAVFIPLTMREKVLPGWTGFDDRRSYWAYLFGRRKPGVSLEQAARQLNSIYQPILAEVEAPLQKDMSASTMAQFKAKTIALAAGDRGQSRAHQNSRTPLLLLLGITAIVLVIACANIANLLLARGAARSVEMAVRLSLGASRSQVMAQLLTESTLLAILGGAGSLLVARATLGLIGASLPSQASTIFHATIDPTVMVFAAVLAIATGILFGLFPALQSTRPDLITSIRANSGQPSGARAATRFRTVLVTGQIALSMMLLVSAGLFVRSLINVSRVDLGLKVDRMVTFGVSPELNGYPAAQSAALFARIAEEVAAVPGVTSVSGSTVPLLGGSNWGTNVAVQGFKKTADTDVHANYNRISAGYFGALGIPLLAGREFESRDNVGAPKVAIINEAFAKKFNLGRDAVGKFMASGGDDELDTQIVGVVQNAKYSSIKEVTPPLFFVPHLQDSTVGAMYFYARTSLGAEQLVRSIPAIITKLDRNLPVEDLKTMEQLATESVIFDRLTSTLSTAFATLATLLAAIGLYGVLSYTVVQRTREFGVRMALGADGGQVRRLVLRQVGRMTLIGGVIGLIGALGLGWAAQSQLFGLSGFDGLVMVVAAAILSAVAFGSGYIPASRASRVHPMQALRQD